MHEILIKLLLQNEIKFTPRYADARNAARMSVIWEVLTSLYKLRILVDKYISDIRKALIARKIDLAKFDEWKSTQKNLNPR